MTSGVDAVGTGISQSNKSAMRNPWVLGWLALVAVVLGVNIFMISMAFWSSPGLVSKDYYDKGKDYEKTVQTRIAARQALGWDLGLQMPGSVTMDKPAAFRLIAADKVGQPLTSAKVVVNAYRPSDADADFSVPLAEVGSGQYVGDVTFPLKGAWDVIIDITQGEHTYQVTRRVSVLGN